MNTLAAYHEPNKITAGLLTLAMHAAFFTLLYLGVNWQVQQPGTMEVDLWSNLPESGAAPQHAAPPAAEQAKPKATEKPEAPAKADIELAKSKQKEVKKTRETAKPEPKKKMTKAQEKRAQEDLLAADKEADTVTSQALAASKDKAAQAAKARAAIADEVNKYRGLISAKIRYSIVMPPDIPETAQAKFVVTLLPDGSVLDAKLIQSSGYSAYDDAVERAIHKAEPLPLPKDETARAQFITPKQLTLKFSPRDGD